MFFRHNVARIGKNSALKRAAGENFAVLCIKTVKKLAILLKIGARGWGIWEKIMARGWGIWPKNLARGYPIPPSARGGVGGAKN